MYKCRPALIRAALIFCTLRQTLSLPSLYQPNEIMRKNMLSLLVVCVLLSSCNSADDKVPQFASDICGCFGNIEAKLSSETKTIFSNAAEKNTRLKDEIDKLSKEDQLKVLSEMTFFDEIGEENSEIGGCIKNVEKKYGYDHTRDKKRLGEKVLQELESRKGCDFTASIWKLGLKLPDEKQ